MSNENHDPNIPLTDITSVSVSSQTTQPTRRRGRPRLSDRPVASLNNTQVTQPIQFTPQQVLPQSPLISRSNGNRGLTLSTAVPTRCISQFPQSNQTSSTTNVGPLTDITNVSGSSRRRGRPRLCDRVVSLDNTQVTQPLQLSPQHVLPQSPLNSRFNSNRTLTPSTTIPSRSTSSPLELSVVANTHDTSTPVRRPRGRPPLHPNVVPARRNVRPRKYI